jgi:hypothetical protein
MLYLKLIKLIWRSLSKNLRCPPLVNLCDWKSRVKEDRFYASPPIGTISWEQNSGHYG